MSLKDITRESVLEAIAEFDRLGRESFLDNYGFKPARQYFLSYDGKKYDSKAIVGVAHGFLSPTTEPLKPESFSGGEATVRRQLEKLGFDVESVGGRNPPWTADELLLTLDLYLRTRPRLPGKASKEVAQLSEELNALGRLMGTTRGERYRNPNGVYMKLCNFLRFDPDYTSKARVGLQRGGHLEEEVWNEFFDNPVRLQAVVASIRAGLQKPELLSAAEDAVDDETAEAPEGKIVTRLHRARERNRELVKKRKSQELQQHGRLICEACGFDFEERYGRRGQGFIECHHTKPVHTLEPGAKTRLSDLALLCANCHRMIHAAKPWLSVEELRGILRTD